ncbi:hypothetical protein Aph02nite_79450 [Actinoplanes philippinensis]|uniref:Secreted protein n=1 Tax=Actinoplanes philippinensis TaxID=35752 RepID=A0A1I2KJ56_9ACTN|nr:hypothetical protein [Actinoplanes philippinensis]GIE81995.1 hypothetical protein Aph02nite_79450 [Actinoplanes philippinensis]SFF65287.1 hypothetical protein SAMN05421541_116170 [Actinoplanes philippinensis]
MKKLLNAAAVLMATAGLVSVTAQPAQAATGFCTVPWSGCETGAVPAGDGVIWINITTPAGTLCDWRVRDTNNWAIVKTRATAQWAERITGVYSWYRLELTNCRTGSTGTIM